MTTLTTMLIGRRKTKITLPRNWRASPRFANKSLQYMHHQANGCKYSLPQKPDANFFKMLTGMAEGPIPGMQVLRWGDTLGWKFSPKKMEVELVHLFCFQGAFGWREGFARVCSWCHRQRSQGGLTSRFDQFMLAPPVIRRENTILYLSWIRFGKSINLFCNVSSLVWFW